MTLTQPEGFIAVPADGTGPGILLLHAWWGLNDTMKAFGTRLADAGFVVCAPDLYHGKVADTIPGAKALVNELNSNESEARAQIAEAIRYLKENSAQSDRGLAVIGFSLGAYFALDLSAAELEHIDSIVLYYGTGPANFGSSKAAYLGHFGEKDDFEPLPAVAELEESIRSAGRPVTFYRYSDAGHWFCEPDRTDAYNEAAANLAWERTLAFLTRRADS